MFLLFNFFVGTGDAVGRADRKGRPYNMPPLPKGRGTSRRLVEGFVRGGWLRVFYEFVFGRIPQSASLTDPLGKGAYIVGRGEGTPPYNIIFFIGHGFW